MKFVLNASIIIYGLTIVGVANGQVILSSSTEPLKIQVIQQPGCEKAPSDVPENCCANFPKFITIDTLQECDRRLKNQTGGVLCYNCLLECSFKLMGVLPNRVMNYALIRRKYGNITDGSDQWKSIITKAVSKCEREYRTNQGYAAQAAIFRLNSTTLAPYRTTTVSPGKVLYKNVLNCIQFHLFLNCPIFGNGSVCTEIFTIINKYPDYLLPVLPKV